MTISSRTPEGEPNRCIVCGAEFRIEPSIPSGDAPCPNCGYLCFFPHLMDIVTDPNGGTSIPDLLAMLEAKGKPGKLALNFQHVSFMSSRMLRQLVQLNKEVTARGGKLVCCNVSPNVREVFKIIKLNKLFPLAED